MKTLKSLLMLCAGLSFCACSSDNEPQLPEGTGAVTVKIKAPSTRTISEATANATVVNGDITLTLTHSRGTVTKTIEYDNGYADDGTDQNFDLTTAGEVMTVTFWGIGTPSLLTASMHDGVKSYSAIDIDAASPNMQAVPTEIPVYGEATATDFQLTSETISGPVQDVDYLKWTAEIQLEIPVARLEVSIKGGDLTDYGSVKVLGVYLDDIYLTDGAASATNYYLEGDVSDYAHATSDADPYAPVKHTYITGTDPNYVYTGALPLTNGSYAPAEDEYYAFNFYPGATFPKVKFLLEVTSSVDNVTIPRYQYAIINDYDLSATGSDEFVKGTIYRIDKLTLNGNKTNNNIQLDEEGSAIEYALVATVTQASWKAFGITGSWAQGN